MPIELTKTRPISMIRRKQQFYVDIPPSPLHTFRSSTRTGSFSGDSVKENAPLLPSHMNSDSSITSLSSAGSASRKRKLSDASRKASGREELLSSNSKKARATPDIVDKGRGSAVVKSKPKPTENKRLKTSMKPENTSEDFPNGFFYCHQCNKKRDTSIGIQCTRKDPSSRVQNYRCKAKYCEPCLRNRYGENLNDIITHGTAGYTKRDKEKHVSGEGFYFECPRCRGTCNCRNCRKALGLEATGNLTLLARKAGKESAAQFLTDDPKVIGILPGKGQQVVPEKKPKMRETKDTTALTVASTSSRKAAGPIKRPPRVKPKDNAASKPTWTRVPTTLAQDIVEVRMHIREFVLRFSTILDIGKGHLEELEELTAASGYSRTQADDEDEDEDLVPWVSEPCVKAIILGLLAIIAEDYSDAISKVIRDAMKEIRACGANLNRIWSALVSLRNALHSIPIPTSLTFPDPLPPPATTTFRSTRSGAQGRSTDSSVYVANSAQLVHVIAELVESAIQTQAVRDEIDRGTAQEKELGREVKEAIAAENARWKGSKASGSKVGTKAERAAHNQTLQDFEHAHRIGQANCIPRFTPLGQDHEGRVYYAMTPGPGEREAALRLIAGKGGKVKISRRRGGFSKDDRKSMRWWSWFIAVWGRMPEGALQAKDDDDSEEDEEDENEDADAWWGFWDPEEIRRVAEWIAMKCELEDGESERRGSAASAMDKGKGVEGRSSIASSTSSRNSGPDPREPSPLSDISSDEGDDQDSSDSDPEGNDALYEGIRTDSNGKPLPTQHELHNLVKGLEDYAALLQWRIQRVAGDGNAENNKGSGVTTSVSAQKFYG
ncbi:hypothetical protein AcW1_008909 [Taiwanofungus camphoratus]|nr:hypothetical protein AcW1_008909 [Antrodia cinnamomea]